MRLPRSRPYGQYARFLHPRLACVSTPEDGERHLNGHMEVDVCPIDELPPGTLKIVNAGEFGACVYNLDGELYAIEDRCSHDDGPLCEGEVDFQDYTVICPRHGSKFEIKTGRVLNPPAYAPVETFPVRVAEDGMIKVDLT